MAKLFNLTKNVSIVSVYACKPKLQNKEST